MLYTSRFLMHNSNKNLKVGVGEAVRVTVGVSEAVRVALAVADSVGVEVAVSTLVGVAGSGERVDVAIGGSVGVGVGITTGADLKVNTNATSRRIPRMAGMKKIRNLSGKKRFS